MKTSTPKPQAPEWVLIDAEGQSLGRLAAKAATVLRGKHRPTFVPHEMCGDHVIIINAAKMGIPAAKLHRKTYVKHTGYLGHISSMSLEKMMEKDPTAVLEIAVKGMLPGNRLRPSLLKRLHVYNDATHDHDAQQPVSLTLA
jgi:large subunit ribosomal protein L13